MATNPTEPPRSRTPPPSFAQPPSLPTSPLPKRFKMSSDSTAPYPPGLSLALDHELHGPRNDSSAATKSNQAAAMDGPTSTIPLQVKLLHPAAKPPTRGSQYAAGYDIYVCESSIIPKWGKAVLSTGISIAIPPGTYGRIAPRSGLAAKHSLATGAGVIDYDYRGELKVLLFNHSDVDFTVSAGDRMAQLVLERIVTPDVVVVEELEGTERGAGGFGSTGGFGTAADVLKKAANGA